MLCRERILESLLEISGAHLRSRAEVHQQVLHAALLLAECEGAALVSLCRRRFERVTLLADRARPESAEMQKGGSDFTRLLVRLGRPLSMADLAEDARAAVDDRCPGLDAGPALFVPLRQREHQPGYLAVYRRRGSERFDPAATQLVTLLAAWAVMALENLRLAESVEKLAVTDELTQVYNYRFIKTALKRELKRAQRFGQELSLVMLDVDNLKAYNDRNGHLRGSFLLKEMAALLASQLRSFDLVAKYGGDEFTLILPQTSREGALTVAERMRETVEGHAFPLVGRGEITISLGVASYPSDAADSNGLIRAADRALYAAKQHGRNRVTLFEGAVA
ncbi:MAG: sensor domain-containing diguanylate cyclase [Candidatus Eisenbacteria bacterium]|nr:sensor domain-containing diguanylate cyclase [Candidatus Eisenbacteria bacterium]